MGARGRGSIRFVVSSLGLLGALGVAACDSSVAPRGDEIPLAELGDATKGAVAFRADCASCHATRDGFDLAFFAFTDTTIVRRALAHVDMGTAIDIVAHVHSLGVSGSSEDARPFQPAGEVLHDDLEFALRLFGSDEWPAGLTTAQLRAIDPRTTPVAVELPIWSIEENNLDWMPDDPLPESLLAHRDDMPRRRLQSFYAAPSVEGLVAAVQSLRVAVRDAEDPEALCVMNPIERLQAEECFEARRWISTLGAQFMLRYGLDGPVSPAIHDAWWDVGNVARRTVVSRAVRGEVDNALDNWVSWMYLGWVFEPDRHASVYLASGLERQGLRRHATFHVLRAAVARGRNSFTVYRDVRNAARFAPAGWLAEAVTFGFEHLIERLDDGERPADERVVEARAEVERAYSDAAQRLSDSEAAALATLRDQVLARLN